MNIRPMRSDEMKVIMEQLYGRSVIAKKITDTAFDLIQVSYHQYVQEFKYSWLSPLTFKPVSYKKYLSNLLGEYGRTLTVRTPRVVDKVGGSSFPALYLSGTARSNFVEQNSKDLLALADYCTDKIFSELDDLRFCDIVCEYSTDPHTFTYDEILRIENLIYQFIYMTKEFNRIMEVRHASQAALS